MEMEILSWDGEPVVVRLIDGVVESWIGVGKPTIMAAVFEVEGEVVGWFDSPRAPYLRDLLNGKGDWDVHVCLQSDLFIREEGLEGRVEGEREGQKGYTVEG